MAERRLCLTVLRHCPGWCDGAVNTHYGAQPAHELMERTTWHAAQHLRQLYWFLDRMGITAEAPLTDADLAGCRSRGRSGRERPSWASVGQDAAMTASASISMSAPSRMSCETRTSVLAGYFPSLQNVDRTSWMSRSDAASTWVA